MSRTRSIVPAAVLAVVALTGCDAVKNFLSTAPAPVPSATPSPAPSATEAPAASATATPTPDPSATPKPTVTTMYVMNGLSKTIDAVNLKTGVVTKSVLTTGLYPNQLLADGSTGYLVNSGDANVVKLDLLAKSQLGKVDLPVGANPMSVTSVGDGKGLVVNLMAKTAVFVNLATMAVESTLNLPSGQPGGGVAVASGKAYVAAVGASYASTPPYAATFTFSGIYVIDIATKAITKTITLDNDANPLPVAKDPDGKIQVGFKGGVLTIDPATDTVVRTVAFTMPVNSIDFFSADKAYGAAGYTGLVSFNPKTGAVLRSVDQKIPAGDTSVGNFRIRGGLAYVPNFASDSVTVIDLATEAATGSAFQVGDGPQELAFVTVDE